MQLVEGTDQSEGVTTVLGPSLALDLSWAIHAVWKPHLREGQPALATLYDEHPELADRVRDFWDDELGCFIELEVLAAWADALEVVDLESLLPVLADALTTVPLDLPLESETDRDRTILRARLAQMRRSPRLVRKWQEMLTEVWSGLDDAWRTSGIPLVERAVVDARSQLDRGTDWVQLVSSECETFTAHLPEILDRHREGRRVVIIPCAFFGKALYLEMPACIVIGLGTARADAMARARTVDVARRLRAVADPTRLAILDHLADGSRSVGEIARSFSLAQPTVSTHVKHLREAGLVSAERRGSRRCGVAQP